MNYRPLIIVNETLILYIKVTFHWLYFSEGRGQHRGYLLSKTSLLEKKKFCEFTDVKYLTLGWSNRCHIRISYRNTYSICHIQIYNSWKLLLEYLLVLHDDKRANMVLA